MNMGRFGPGLVGAIVAVTAIVTACADRAHDTVVAVTATVPSTHSSTGAVDLRFRPVLQILPPEETVAVAGPSGTAYLATTRPEDDQSDQAVVLPEVDPGGTVVRRYRLGPTFLDRSAIGHAEAVYQNGWQVTLSFKDGASGIDSWNRVCQECFDGAPSCPGIGSSGKGLVAIVVDSRVTSAPEIQPDNAAFVPFGGDQITISGSFTEAEARKLAIGLSQP